MTTSDEKRIAALEEEVASLRNMLASTEACFDVACRTADLLRQTHKQSAKLGRGGQGNRLCYL